MLDFEICPFQNRQLEPKGLVQFNGKSDKKCTFCAKFAFEKKKNGSITFSQFYICLNVARALHININKLGGGSLFSLKKKNAKKTPKNSHLCTIARYRFTKAQQCNSVSAFTPCNRCVPGRKMLPTRVLALCTQCIVSRAIQTA